MAEDKARERIEMNQLYLTQEILPRLRKLPKQSSGKARMRLSAALIYVDSIIAGNKAYLEGLEPKQAIEKCEECGVELQRIVSTATGLRGYSCDSCGFSWDD